MMFQVKFHVKKFYAVQFSLVQSTDGLEVLKIE
ncbi:hypothetical protein ABIE27_006260 [Paenibacillus sp. 4624]